MEQAAVQAASPARMTPSRLIAWVRGILTAPPVPETPAEAGERRRATRAGAGEQIARSRATADAELPKLAAEEERSRRHLEKLTPAYQEATRAYDRARMAHARRAADLDYEQVLATRQIESCAEPVIDEFATGLMDLHAATLKTPVEEHERNPLWHPEEQKQVFETWGNRPAILARAAAVMDAYRTAIAMKADANQDDVRERLAALVENLPDASEMTLLYKPPMREPSRRWPTYEEQRAELIGMHPEELRRLRRGNA